VPNASYLRQTLRLSAESSVGAVFDDPQKYYRYDDVLCVIKHITRVFKNIIESIRTFNREVLEK
jgi:hypothetical protein